MKRFVVAAVSAALVVVIVAAGSGADPGQNPNAPRRDGDHGHWFKRACDVAPAHVASCDAQLVTDSAGNPLVTNTTPSGYGPTQFHNAYSLPTSAPSAQTIAIVDAYDDPNIEADLGAYDTNFGLPACTTANGCFRKVNQTGGTSYPAANANWSLEIALDVETAHQTCQNCHILLVEATTSSMSDLGTAVNEAVALGANVISNSYGGGESSGETTWDNQYFNHPGVVITASSGDGGYGVEYPAASRYVTAVGGTTLNVGSGGNWLSETAWSGAGSGCSAYESKPVWQTDAGCSRRTVADVSADADPNTGAAVYDSVTYQGQSGWFQVGGTSLASPLIASVYALAGNAASSSNATPYSHTSSLHDITSGSNGSCGSSYLCTAKAGYDGPTGLGTPSGLTAFGGGGSASPDFSLGVSPSTQTVTSPASGVYTLTVGALNGFTGTVSFSETGVPATDVSFSGPVTGSGSATMTVSTSSLSGTYNLTITGTSGSTTHTVPATLVVQSAPAPDFSISVSPSSATIARSGSSHYTVSITPLNSFTGTVALSATDNSSSLTQSFSPTSIAPGTTSTLTVTASGLRKHGSFTVTITGKSGALSHSTTLKLST